MEVNILEAGGIGATIIIAVIALLKKMDWFDAKAHSGLAAAVLGVLIAFGANQAGLLEPELSITSAISAGVSLGLASVGAHKTMKVFGLSPEKTKRGR